MTAAGSRPPAPRPALSGRSRIRTARWANSRNECGVRRVKVSRVACHPKALAVAIGYEDGWILLCRMTDGAEILIRRTEAGTQDPITAFAWDRDGRHLLFGTGGGEAGLLEMPG